MRCLPHVSLDTRGNLILGLPLKSKIEAPKQGLSYEFLEGSPNAKTGPVLTGHANGVTTVNVAEADDAERERRRLQLAEHHRTLLGNSRHESGHYYWDRL